jgi:ABC-type bacteriocin/lantibiotic exporter with double-glycine peptidase domain
LALNLDGSSDAVVWNSASTQKGCSLPQVADLSRKIGLNYQMAFRKQGGDFTVPSVVHWKVGHYAALVRKEGNLYCLQDPAFGNSTWATRQALETETSGYFLVPTGLLPEGWRRRTRGRHRLGQGLDRQ